MNDHKRKICLRTDAPALSAMQLQLFQSAARQSEPEPDPSVEPLAALSTPEPEKALELSDLIGGSLGSLLSSTFGRMEIAEDEIERAQRRHSEKADAIWSSFKHLVPTEVLGQTGDELYRHHCHELLERVAHGQDVRPGTAAEVVAGLAAMSQVAPPSRTMTLLYMKLFSELFPEKARTIFEETGPMTPDSYEETRIAELEVEFRRKLTAPRGL